MPEKTVLADLDETPHAEVFAADRPRTVRLALEPDERIPAHTHPGMDVVIHVVEGTMEIGLDEETHALAAGELLRFSGEREVAPRATSGATAVVVLAPTPGTE